MKDKSDVPRLKPRPMEVGFTKTFVIKLKRLSAVIKWLTSKRSAELLPSLV